MVLVNIPVGQDQDVGPVTVGPVHVHKQTVDGLFQIGVLVVADGDGLHLEAQHLHGLDLQKVGLGEDGVVDFQDLAVVGVLLQQVALRAHVHRGGGDYLFPQRVDGRVGDLGEHLFEIVEQRGTGMAQHRERGVAAHGAGRLTAVFRHLQHDAGHILVPVAKRLLQPHQFLRSMGGDFLVGNFQITQIHQIAVQPLAVGLAAGVVHFQTLIVHQSALDGVHQQHFAGTQTILADNVLRVDVQHAHFAGEDEPVVIGDIVAAGAQTVAVQHRAHHIAVTEQNGGGAIPRLQHGGVILVEIPLFGVHVFVVAPRFRDGHHHGQRQVHAVHHHEFQRVVQHGGVRAVLIDDGQHLGHVIFQIAAAHGLLAGQHGVHIAADGVDLAVVQDKPVGVRPVPAGLGVGGEPAVHHADGGFIIGVL